MLSCLTVLGMPDSCPCGLASPSGAARDPACPSSPFISGFLAFRCPPTPTTAPEECLQSIAHMGLPSHHSPPPDHCTTAPLHHCTTAPKHHMQTGNGLRYKAQGTVDCMSVVGCKGSCPWW